MRARYFFDPPGDARPAPHSAPPGLRRADPLRPTKPTERPDPQDPAAQLHNNIPHSEGAARASVSKNAPALLPRPFAGPQAKARSLPPGRTRGHAPGSDLGGWTRAGEPTAVTPPRLPRPSAFAEAPSSAPASRPTRRTECPPGPTPPSGTWRHLGAPNPRPTSPSRTGPHRILP
jgi:hypothetical protein